MRSFCAVIALLCTANGTFAQQTDAWFDVPVPGGAATLEALNIRPDERAFTIPILARALHDRDARSTTLARLSSLIGAASARTDEAASAVMIPMPLDVAAWEHVLPPQTGHLFTRLVSDRNALILAAGLMSTDPSVRVLLTRDRDLLRFIAQNAAGAVAVAGRSLRVVNGTVVTPRGAEGSAAWRALVGTAPERSGPFLRALLTKDAGRAAWFFDTLAAMSSERLQVAWPVPRTHATLATLYEAFRDSDPQWRLPEQPFRRNVLDAWSVVNLAAIGDGRVVSPFSQEMWTLVFSDEAVTAEAVERVRRGQQTAVTLAWLGGEIATLHPKARRARFEMFRLVQRVFAAVSPAEHVAVAMAANQGPRYRALMFALERMGVKAASTWLDALRAAKHVSDESDDRAHAFAAFQAAVALLERLRHVGTLSAPDAEALLGALSAAVTSDTRVAQSIGAWLTGTLAPRLSSTATSNADGDLSVDETLLEALAGPRVTTPGTVDWEGLRYRVDLHAAERDRLLAVRALLPAPTIDVALERRDPRALAESLTALVYATALGDPDGAVSLSPDVATRHDFGLRATALLREELPWAPPEERQGLGTWRVQGSLLGLDLGLSRLAPRRIVDDQMPGAPTLTLNDLATLTRTIVALRPRDLREDERDEIAAAIARGRERVRGTRGELSGLSELAAEVDASPTMRQVLPWRVRHDPEAARQLFSLGQLLWLGRPLLTQAQLDRWGLAAEALDGRRVTAMPRPAPWEDFAGRSEAGQVSTQVPDLTLRLVEETAQLRLPAALIPGMLAFAIEDFWHEVQVRFTDDWPQLVRQAALVSSTRISDYVAALAGSGPLRAQ